MSFFRRERELSSIARDAMKSRLETKARESSLEYAVGKSKIGVPPKKSNLGRNLAIAAGLSAVSAPIIKNMVDEHRKRKEQ